MKPVHVFSIIVSLIASAAICVGAAMYGFRLSYDEMAAGEAGLSTAKQIAEFLVQAILFIPLLLRKIFDSNAAVFIGLALQFVFYAVVLYRPLLKLFTKRLASSEGLSTPNENHST